MILLASGVAQFFVFLFALNAVLFVVAFLWNIRQMKLIDYLGAVRFFMGLGAAASLRGAGARAKFAEDVQAFSAEEEAMLRSVLERLAPRIAMFPLMSALSGRAHPTASSMD